VCPLNRGGQLPSVPFRPKPIVSLGGLSLITAFISSSLALTVSSAPRILMTCDSPSSSRLTAWLRLSAGTLSRRLRTPPLPVAHAPVGSADGTAGLVKARQMLMRPHVASIAYVSISPSPLLRSLSRRGRALLVWFRVKPAFPPRASHHLWRPEGGKDVMRSVALRDRKRRGAIQGRRARAVAVRQDWRGGLERSGARSGRVGRPALHQLRSLSRCTNSE